MATPKLTVLMTVYNGGEYLRQSVPSILNQTFKDFEFLIVDDCSTDQGLGYVKSLSDDRIRVHRNPQNFGQTRSLNVGLNLAQGEYVARIDADDRAFPRWLENQMNFIQGHPEYAVVSTKAAIIDKNSRFVKILNTPNTHQEILLKSLYASPINHVGSVSKRDVLIKNGGYDESFKIAADYDLWSRLLRQGWQFGSTLTIGVAVRAHGESASVVEKGKRDILEVPKIMKENIRHWTRLDYDAESMILFWKLIYAVDTLDEGQFREMIVMLRKIYGQLNLAMEKVFIRETRQSVEKVVFVKRIFSLIEQKAFPKVRFLAQDFKSQYGLFNPIGMIGLLSHLGDGVLRVLPKIYRYILIITTSLRLFFDSYRYRF